MQFLAQTLKYKVLKPPNKRGSYIFLETLGGSYGSAKEKTKCLKACAMASSRPML
jgi:hypothetical protein